MQDLSTQLKLIKKGAVELISEDELVKKLQENRPLRVKFGVDPTTADIHLGHTVALTKLRQFQELGHKVVFLIGDFTAQIGDPSGRSETRKPLTAEEVARNAETYLQQVFKILDKDPARLEVVYNSHWLGKMGVKEIIGLASRYTVARMLERDDFQKRYKEGTPISILEFLYPLMQGFDSVQIDADVEIGGSDQKFNLLVGRELMRDYGKKSAQVVLTMPLLEGLDGVRKMSKSYNNYIGITEPPKEIFGKIMSVSDELMYRYYELLTNEEVAEIKKQHPMEAKKKLGEIMVARFYDEAAAGAARAEFEKIFSKNQNPEHINTFFFLEDLNLAQNIHVSGVANDMSIREIKKIIEQGGVEINKDKVLEHTLKNYSQEFYIRIGKKNFGRIELAPKNETIKVIDFFNTIKNSGSTWTFEDHPVKVRKAIQMRYKEVTNKLSYFLLNWDEFEPLHKSFCNKVCNIFNKNNIPFDIYIATLLSWKYVEANNSQIEIANIKYNSILIEKEELDRVFIDNY